MKRAKAVFEDRPCEACGLRYPPRSAAQKYCDVCAQTVRRKAAEARYRVQRAKSLGEAAAHAEKLRVYRKRRAELGFIQRTYWVHRDDAEALQVFVKMLAENRINKIGVPLEDEPVDSR